MLITRSSEVYGPVLSQYQFDLFLPPDMNSLSKKEFEHSICILVFLKGVLEIRQEVFFTEYDFKCYVFTAY